MVHSKKCNYGKSATIKYEITKHDKTIYNSPAVELLKKLDELIKQLEKAELTLKTIALNLTTDPKDMRVVYKDWCCDQECLNLVNKYFEEKK